MDNLNQIELQNVRHIYGHCKNYCEKIEYYKTLTQDQNVNTVLDKLCNESKNLKQAVCSML